MSQQWFMMKLGLSSSLQLSYFSSIYFVLYMSLHFEISGHKQVDKWFNLLVVVWILAIGKQSSQSGGLPSGSHLPLHSGSMTGIHGSCSL